MTSPLEENESPTPKQLSAWLRNNVQVQIGSVVNEIHGKSVDANARNKMSM